MMARLSKILSKICRKNEGGFVLYELLIAILISGIIITGVSSAVLQVITVKALSSNILIATKQVDNVFHYLIRDVQMCNATALEDFFDPTPPGEPWLEFKWTWPNGYYVTRYEVVGDNLFRNQTINNVPAGNLRVAQFIETDLLDRALQIGDDSLYLNVTVAATVGGYKTASENRIINVAPRLTSDYG